MNETQTEINIESQNSCEISINAKGKWSGKVKSYATSLEEAYEMTLKKAEQLEKLISDKNADELPNYKNASNKN